MPNAMGIRLAKRISVILGSSHIEAFIISLLGPYAKRTKLFTIESMPTNEGIHEIVHAPAEARSKAPIRRLINTATAGSFPVPQNLSHSLAVIGLIRITNPINIMAMPVILTIIIIIYFFPETVTSSRRDGYREQFL